MTSATYDPVAATYDDGYDGPIWRVYDHATMETARPYLPPPGGHILDAGAGTGKWAVRFLGMGYRVTLLEPSAPMLDVARRKIGADGAATFIQGSIESIDAPDASFDLVFCEGDPLSYASDRARAAGELMRVLRPGGGFYVSCDNRWFAALALLAASDRGAFARCIERGDSFDPYGAPVHAFEPAELEALLVAAGAADVRVTGKVVFSNFLATQALADMLARPEGRALLDAETRLAADPRAAGLAGHLHAVGRKRAR